MPLAMILHLWPANQTTIMGVALCHKNWLLRDGCQHTKPTFLFSRSDRDRLCCRVLLIVYLCRIVLFLNAEIRSACPRTTQ